jgi:hypothetical protein
MTETEAASLGEEIRLLVEMVLERAAPWLDGVIAAGHGAAQDRQDAQDRQAGQDGQDRGNGEGTETANCGWCPLCAVVAVVRGERPEFAARVLEQARQLIALLRAVLADRWEPGEGVHMPGFRPSSRPASTPDSTRASRPAAERVQHIPVRWQET